MRSEYLTTVERLPWQALVRVLTLFTTLPFPRQVREALAKGDQARVNLIIEQLCGFLTTASPQSVNARNGGLIGLAGISIALGMNIAPYLEQIVPPVLACFTDPDSKIRYVTSVLCLHSRNR